MATTKIQSKVCLQEQSSSSFEEDAMISIPYTSYDFVQKRNMIDDESYRGLAFKDLPQKGVNDTSGVIGCNLDLVSFAAYIKAVTGYYSGGIALFDQSTINVTKMSLARRDGISYKKYANVYAKSFKISGSSDNLISTSLDLIGVTPEDRAALAGYPTPIAEAGEALSFHEMSGSGYFRVGDQADALAAGDNLKIEEFSFEIVTGFDAQHYNAYQILTPEFGQVPPGVTGSFRISTHNVDTFIDFRDNATKLQLELLIYKSATQSLKVVVPNFIIDLELTDDDLARQGVTMKIGRNGVGTSYVNSNYSFTSPIHFTVVNT